MPMKSASLKYREWNISLKIPFYDTVFFSSLDKVILDLAIIIHFVAGEEPLGEYPRQARDEGCSGEWDVQDKEETVGTSLHVAYEHGWVLGRIPPPHRSRPSSLAFPAHPFPVSTKSLPSPCNPPRPSSRSLLMINFFRPGPVLILTYSHDSHSTLYIISSTLSCVKPSLLIVIYTLGHTLVVSW